MRIAILIAAVLSGPAAAGRYDATLVEMCEKIAGKADATKAGLLAARKHCEGVAPLATTERIQARIEARAAVTEAEWPARMQRLTRGPLVEAAGHCELWLDGGHNPAGGKAVAATLAAMARKPMHLICGMLNTKDVAGYMRPMATVAQSLTAVAIPGEPNTLSAEETAAAAGSVGLPATTAPDALSAVQSLASAHPGARILICGSLYLGGYALDRNGTPPDRKSAPRGIWREDWDAKSQQVRLHCPSGCYARCSGRRGPRRARSDRWLSPGTRGRHRAAFRSVRY